MAEHTYEEREETIEILGTPEPVRLTKLECMGHGFTMGVFSWATNNRPSVEDIDMTKTVHERMWPL
jgi:hypothetical protein